MAAETTSDMLNSSGVCAKSRCTEGHVEDRAMSKETERLAQTIEMLELMNDALRHLRKEVLPKNP
jgi:hypothetical protein